MSVNTSGDRPMVDYVLAKRRKYTTGSSVFQEVFQLFLIFKLSKLLSIQINPAGMNESG